eukprot:9807385-Prorocentrum_lima.AAC.1
MTSSLVGSEMCIRDRQRLRISNKGRIMWNPPEGHDCITFEERSIPSAVSYTHLTLPTICSV